MKIMTVLAAVALCLAGCSEGDSAPNTETSLPTSTVAPAKSTWKAPQDTVASIKLSEMDVRYIKGELDEDEFEKLILKTNPDIRRMKYEPGADYDSDVTASRKSDFRRALYFAKKIQLANGKTLFEWLKACPYSMGDYMYATKVHSASGAYESFASNLAFMAANYYPVLMMRGVERMDDINLSWVIYEDGTIKAFSVRGAAYLEEPDFETGTATACRP